MDMDAKWFFQSFTCEVYHKDPSFMNIYWTDAREFTSIIMQVINSIIRKGECFVSNEYYRVDASGWKNYCLDIQDQAESIQLNPHLWDLMIVVEHENNRRDWSDEVMKLLHIRCPVKVVIGYNDCRDNKPDHGLFSDENKLSVISQWMESSSAMKYIRAAEISGKHEELLIILGNAGANPIGSCEIGGQDRSRLPELKRSFDYRGYLYNIENKAFEEI